MAAPTKDIPSVPRTIPDKIYVERPVLRKDDEKIKKISSNVFVRFASYLKRKICSLSQCLFCVKNEKIYEGSESTDTKPSISETLSSKIASDDVISSWNNFELFPKRTSNKGKELESAEPPSFPTTWDEEKVRARLGRQRISVIVPYPKHSVQSFKQNGLGRSHIEFASFKERIIMNLDFIADQIVIDSLPRENIKGLRNLGNSCYMNACLQMLERHLEGNREFEFIWTNSLKKGKQSLLEFETACLSAWPRFENVLNSENAILFKWSFLLLIQAKKFASKAIILQALENHHDLCFLLNLHSDFNYGKGKTKDPREYLDMCYGLLLNPSTLTLNYQNSCDVGGIIYSGAVCSDPFPCIILPIYDMLRGQRGKKKAIVDGFAILEEFFEAEYIPEVEFKISEKKIWTRGRRVVGLQEPWPDAFFLHMKRFENAAGNLVKKIPNPINFDGIMEIDLNRYAWDKKNAQGKEALYEITSFVVHEGDQLVNGHFKAYVKKNNHWYLCDDSFTYDLGTSCPEQIMDAYICSYTIKNSGKEI